MSKLKEMELHKAQNKNEELMQQKLDELKAKEWKFEKRRAMHQKLMEEEQHLKKQYYEHRYAIV